KIFHLYNTYSISDIYYPFCPLLSTLLGNLEILNNDNQSEFERLVREEVSKRLGAKSSKKSTTKDSEWTDSENVEERSRNVTETSNRKNDDNFRSLFIT
ncbi:10873_t:CDS:2, partial [Gigaspora margarita]